MSKVSIVVLALCALQCTNGLLFPDPLSVSITKIRSQISNVNGIVSSARGRVSVLITTAKLEILPPIQNLEVQLIAINNECSIGVAPQLAKIRSQVNALDACRSSVDFNALQNKYVASLRAQITEAEGLRDSCKNSADPTTCISEAASRIDANVQAIVLSTRDELAPLEQAASNCVEENSAAIKQATTDLSTELEKCNP